MSGRPGLTRSAEEWRDAFFSLDERYRQLQQKINDQEKEMKLLKVAQRRKLGPSSSEPIVGIGRNVSNATGPSKKDKVVQEEREGLVPDGKQQQKEACSVQFVAAPSMARRDDSAAAISEAAALCSLTPPPDPSMVWGMENSVQNYVTANALYHANEEMRHRLEDCIAMVKSLQHELSASRALTRATQSRLDESAQQIQQLVRERDIACQKLSIAQGTAAELERQQKQASSEEERVRFLLESQITELRNRLVVGADSNEALARDVRTLMSDVKEKSASIQGLRSKLSLAEAALASQRQTNENLLVELRGLNAQLVEERKRLLSMTQELQLASLRADDIRGIEARLAIAVGERDTLEREQVKLMESLVNVTDKAMLLAREEVKRDLDELRDSAVHWEEVARLLYKDISQRTLAHVHCREECEEAKRLRDETAVALRSATSELQSCQAKLNIVWPTHRTDTAGLTEEQILSIFGKRKVNLKGRGSLHQQQGDHLQEEVGEEGHRCSVEHPQQDSEAAYFEEDFMGLLRDSSLEEQVRDLQEVNTSLMAELQRLQMTNDLQGERLRSLEANLARERENVKTTTAEFHEREAASQVVLQSQLDRVSFLEAQVHSLRGYDVSPGKSICEVGGDETVFELFVGQILSAETPEGVGLRNKFPPVFCSIDFLLHETVTTHVVTGLNAFLDTTISFCVAMDTLLLYYLQTRQLLVQLHRVHSKDEIDDTPCDRNDAVTTFVTERLYDTVAEGSVDLSVLATDPKYRESQRPVIRGHVPLCDTYGRHLASVEFCVTVRTPFSEYFRALAAGATKTWNPPQSNTERHSIRDSLSSVTAVSSALSTPQVTTALDCKPAVTEGFGHRGVRNARGGRAEINERRMVLMPTERRSNAVEMMSTTSSSVTVLERSSNFTLVPRAAAIASVSSLNAVNMLVVDVSMLRLPHHLHPVPRLSCYYSLKSIGCDVYLEAPLTPRYQFDYSQQGGTSGKHFPIRSRDELLAATREPFVLFFFDESSTPNAPAGGPGALSRLRESYWAMAMTEWRIVLENPEEFVSLELPLINRQGAQVEEASVRVRLLATCRGEGIQSGSLPVEETTASAPAATPDAQHPQQMFSTKDDQTGKKHSQQQLPEGLSVGTDGNVGGDPVVAAPSEDECPEGSIDMELIRRQLGF
uniref:RPGR-interacting protein 1 first C2 domain-containing protein n=1 Tax=Trypanosoma congolense (strain IL3000) TaxID=1068625 RepID=G0URU0_TRYCI|nr:conserved hypothetical protein [Trypanosoma congolense IL3000]